MKPPRVLSRTNQGNFTNKLVCRNPEVISNNHYKVHIIKRSFKCWGDKFKSEASFATSETFSCLFNYHKPSYYIIASPFPPLTEWRKSLSQTQRSILSQFSMNENSRAETEREIKLCSRRVSVAVSVVNRNILVEFVVKTLLKENRNFR